MKSEKNDIKKLFMKKGACSHTFFYVLNREFGHPKEKEEQASDPLAGGIFQQGYQCGMLWGASLAVGSESYRRHNDRGLAIAKSITATQHIMRSFVKRTGSADCYDITHCDLTSKSGMAKLMLKTIMGGFVNSPCFNLAEKWTPEAIQSSKEGLSAEVINLPGTPLSCASELARIMGASDEQMVMVSGFAGGLGLSGNACGALSAAIWMKTLARVNENNYKYKLSDPELSGMINTFHKETGYEMECSKICGQKFNTIGEHSEFIKNGGCQKLINALAGS